MARACALSLCLLLAAGCGAPGKRAVLRAAVRRLRCAAARRHPRLCRRRDGALHHARRRYLLFNNRNDPRVDTNLHYAERVDDVTFDYRGELKGANSPALDGVAKSVDRDGNLFFISTRSYAQTLSTVYRARFGGGVVTGLDLVQDISLRRPGMVIFDAEISPGGEVLFIVDGEFTGGPNPRSADIAAAIRDGGRFRLHPASAEFMRNVNTPALEYAPAISADLLELLLHAGGESRRLGAAGDLSLASRGRDEPFGEAERVAAIAGFVERRACPATAARFTITAWKTTASSSTASPDESGSRVPLPRAPRVQRAGAGVSEPPDPIYVPAAPGGTTDLLARLFAAKLGVLSSRCWWRTARALRASSRASSRRRRRPTATRCCSRITSTRSTRRSIRTCRITRSTTSRRSRSSRAPGCCWW